VATLVLVSILPATLAVEAQPGPRKAHPPGVATDDPAGEAPGRGFDGAGLRNVQAFLGGQSPARRDDLGARKLSLVGALKLSPFNQGVHADMAAFDELAFVGKWRGDCPATGVDIVDISEPEEPEKIADTADYPDTSMEDMQAMQIESRDVLAIGLQDCGNDPSPGVGKSGLELVDISNPKKPRTLSFFDTNGISADSGGVHELDLTKTPNDRVLALLAVPGLEALTADDAGQGGTGDLLIVDISDPTRPALVAEWGVLGEPALGLSLYLGARQGSDRRTQLHSVRANKDGTLAYLSYWDAGVIVLNISDPAKPVFVGRTSFQPGEEGNAHSVDEVRGGRILVQADEDFSPFEPVFSSNAFAGTRPSVEAEFTPPIADRPGREATGEVVHVGRGCPGLPGSPEDPYLASPAGKVALIERGACRFDHKIGRAVLAGATGAIIYNSAAGGEELVQMAGENPVTLPDGTVVSITVPALFVQRSTGLLLRDGAQPVMTRMVAQFNGWGFLRIFDLTDPARPVQLSTYKTPNTNNEAVARQGTWSVHNPEVRGKRVFASWYNDGVRVIDISEPSAPREIGFWTGKGAPDHAPPVNVWSVVPHDDMLLVSDRNFGLYILEMEDDED
jgi:hypothetical protein